MRVYPYPVTAKQNIISAWSSLSCYEWDDLVVVLHVSEAHQEKQDLARFIYPETPDLDFVDGDLADDFELIDQDGKWASDGAYPLHVTDRAKCALETLCIAAEQYQAHTVGALMDALF